MIDIEKFRAFLENTKVEQRYKPNKDGELYNAEDLNLMITEIYKSKVELRQKEFNSLSEGFITKAVKWLLISDKPGLLLFGTIGSGKTTLADSIYKLISILNPASILRRKTAIELVEIAKEGKDIFEDLSVVKMLFIDDLGEEALFIKNFGNETSPLVNLLYKRYDKMLFTVITTNLTEAEISSRYGARVWDRIEELFDFIYFDIKSFRK